MKDQECNFYSQFSNLVDFSHLAEYFNIILLFTIFTILPKFVFTLKKKLEI